MLTTSRLVSPALAADFKVVEPAGAGAVLAAVALLVFFFFPFLLPEPPARAAPIPPRQHNRHESKSSHCQICMMDPEEPEALEPEESPDECPGMDEPLTLEPVLSEPDDDINEAKLLPDESNEPEEESHAVHDDVVVAFIVVLATLDDGGVGGIDGGVGGIVGGCVLTLPVPLPDLLVASTSIASVSVAPC